MEFHEKETGFKVPTIRLFQTENSYARPLDIKILGLNNIYHDIKFVHSVVQLVFIPAPRQPKVFKWTSPKKPDWV